MTTEYSPEFLIRYWAKIDCTAGLFECWNWTAGKTPDGYGLIRLDKTKKVYAHHVAYELANGERGGLQVLHACDNPPCCNPAHLVLGTIADNMRDRETKGRGHLASTGDIYKLTDAQVNEIRQEYAAGFVAQADLSKIYHVVGRQIGGIVRHEQRYRVDKSHKEHSSE